jgi:hypothetical protein
MPSGRQRYQSVAVLLGNLPQQFDTVAPLARGEQVADRTELFRGGRIGVEENRLGTDGDCFALGVADLRKVIREKEREETCQRRKSGGSGATRDADCRRVVHGSRRRKCPSEKIPTPASVARGIASSGNPKNNCQPMTIGRNVSTSSWSMKPICRFIAVVFEPQRVIPIREQHRESTLATIPFYPPDAFECYPTGKDRARSAAIDGQTDSTLDPRKNWASGHAGCPCRIRRGVTD